MLSRHLLKVAGRYVCAWHAYPGAEYEEGPAVIGLTRITAGSPSCDSALTSRR